jgi:sarcosine oxidase subunit beta
MTSYFSPWRMWRRPEPKKAYDVVIIGGGVHGLATAYELAKRGTRNIAVLEKSYIGAGGSGRNTTIIRSNYRTPEGVRFYDQSVKRYERLSQELDYNLLFSQQGHITLAHTERAMMTMVERAEINQLLGVNSVVVGRKEIAELCPELDLSERVTYPIEGGLYHPPGAVIRHDAVVWAYARAADRLGVDILPATEVTGIDVKSGRVSGVQTNRGPISSPTVVAAVAGWSTQICAMAGVELPIVTHNLQAYVTEPIKPLLHIIIVSATLHVYVSQTDRGELLIGSEIEPYSTYSFASTLNFLETSARHAVALLPRLRTLKVLRSWTGLCDVTPDYSPIMGETDVGGFFVDCGWGTYGFKAAPISGACMADAVVTGRSPELIAAFSPSRFRERKLVSELAAAAVSH